jgi:mannose-1-phosphate guanylyltransferase
LTEHTFIVLMAGGSGTRFWPLSRRTRPKQMLPIAGESPMIRETLDRLGGTVPPERILVVTGADQSDGITEVLPEIPKENLLLEPAPRNTAPCLGLAAVTAIRRDPDAVLLCLPADHVIRPAEAFRNACGLATKRAEQAGTLLTFGIRPTRPATGYGYILAGEETVPGVHAIQEFVEKPDATAAKEYIRHGGYRWNSGMFAWRADAFLAEIARHLPVLSKGLDEIRKDPERLNGVFPSLPSISVDYGVMERTERAEVVDAAFAWDDVGSFEALSRLIPADKAGNHIKGEAVVVDGTDLVVVSDGARTIGALGVSDLVIVATDDVVLVCPRDRAEDVKLLVSKLAGAGREDLA